MINITAYLWNLEIWYFRPTITKMTIFGHNVSAKFGYARAFTCTFLIFIKCYNKIQIPIKI